MTWIRTVYNIQINVFHSVNWCIYGVRKRWDGHCKDISLQNAFPFGMNWMKRARTCPYRHRRRHIGTLLPAPFDPFPVLLLVFLLGWSTIRSWLRDVNSMIQNCELFLNEQKYIYHLAWEYHLQNILIIVIPYWERENKKNTACLYVEKQHHRFNMETIFLKSISLSWGKKRMKNLKSDRS